MILRDGQVVLIRLPDGSPLISAQVLGEVPGYGCGDSGIGKYYELIILEGIDKGSIKTFPQTMILPV